MESSTRASTSMIGNTAGLSIDGKTENNTLAGGLTGVRMGTEYISTLMEPGDTESGLMERSNGG